MCSHVSAKNLEPSARDAGEDIGGNRPSGGIDRREDRQPYEPEPAQPERLLRSADHFRRELARGRNQFDILEHAKASLEAWKRQPPPGDDPEYGTPQWKRFIAESPESHGALATRYGCKRSYIQQ